MRRQHYFRKLRAEVARITVQKLARKQAMIGNNLLSPNNKASMKSLYSPTNKVSMQTFNLQSVGDVVALAVSRESNKRVRLVEHNMSYEDLVGANIFSDNEKTDKIKKNKLF